MQSLSYLQLLGSLCCFDERRFIKNKMQTMKTMYYSHTHHQNGVIAMAIKMQRSMKTTYYSHTHHQNGVIAMAYLNYKYRCIDFVWVICQHLFIIGRYNNNNNNNNNTSNTTSNVTITQAQNFQETKYASLTFF